MAANRWDQLLDHWNGQLKKAFLEAVQKIADTARLDQIAKMLESGDIEGAVKAVGLNPASFRPFDKTFEAAFEAGGVSTAQLAPARLQFQFNIRNEAAEAWLRKHSSDMITDIFDDQRQMIRNALSSAMSKGVNPRTAALDLVGKIGPNGHRQGGLIGLTASQERWVENYMEDLIMDPSKTLNRNMRDKRFDAAIKRYEKEGMPLPNDLIKKMLISYRNRALRYRAETIARTEAMAALHEAQKRAVDQMLANGVVDTQQIDFVWHTAHDNRVRDTHQTMDGQRRKYGFAFITGSGAQLRYPGDPFGPPSEVINCRCWMEPKIDFLFGIR